MTATPHPTRVLVLGGTRWLGRSIAQAHLDRGAEVTCLARGEEGHAPEGARLVIGDRDTDDAYATLGGEWDEIVDVTQLPAHAAGALRAMADRTRHWTFVSSVSAQRLVGAPVGADEQDQLVSEDATGEEYGGAKAWIERVAREWLGERLMVVRPGLIAGPGDDSGRFGYWIARLALAGNEPVLLPARDQSTQAIDVRDLTTFLVDVAPHRGGVVNAVGPERQLHAHIDLAREIADHTGALVYASDEQLSALAIESWAGERALPLTLPAALASHAQRSSARYLGAGGAHRPLRATLESALGYERPQGLDRPSRHRLSRADELVALDSLASLV